ncbi:hypothetical protein RHGRI_035248 [Rhododendron griersonianum]|uniref:Uncharacterized protein n=1 Tax=Rhododendron griersonianum TaxID=479676 RepID=A0AAV6I3T4_9ERIC|nr:hypothetical protein RHGRI_035248 [Rhododendron griersonianum]
METGSKRGRENQGGRKERTTKQPPPLSIPGDVQQQPPTAARRSETGTAVDRNRRRVRRGEEEMGAEKEKPGGEEEPPPKPERTLAEDLTREKGEERFYTSVGLEQGASKPLLKHVFQGVLRLSTSPRKTTLMFVIRDLLQTTDLEILEPILREDIQKVMYLVFLLNLYVGLHP